ncbi:MAG TPA: DUF3817 domain-containing protein [Acidimicrobiales bacterium]|nr:DUF3817 domain-containing protein [Acidimicrobiales bacterium]
MSDTSTPSVAGPSVARPLRIAALAEGVSYAVLLLAMVAKYALDAGGEGGVPIVGPIHGVIVLAYAGLVLMGRDEQGWTIGQMLLALLLSAVPGGGFYVERKMLTVPARPGGA